MLRTCNSCSASFAESMSRCPACGETYVPSEKEILRQLYVEMLRGMARGERIDVLRDHLLQQTQISLEQANVLVDLARKKLRQISRDRGIRLLGFGLFLWFIAFIALAMTGGYVIATGCVTIGFASVIIGSIKMITGWNLADNLGNISDVSPLSDIEDALKI